MTARNYTATTAGQAYDLIAAALTELTAEQLFIAPDDTRAQRDAGALPLSIAVSVALTEGDPREFAALSLDGAVALLRAARGLFDAETRRLHPGDDVAQLDSLWRPAHLTVRYDTAELHRAAAEQFGARR